jgi:uncharacterized YigZ family protein
MENSYNEIKFPAKGIYKDKGSKFIAYAISIYSEDQIKIEIDKVKKLERAARHYCYAYVLNSDKSIQRESDDGEPSSTAGKPILGQLLSNDLTNTLIVVTRFFGGVKLGVPRLINAYKSAANIVITNAKIITKTIKAVFEIRFGHLQINNVMRIVKEHDLKVINNDFQMECELIFMVEKNKSDLIMNIFKKNHKLNIKYIKTI